MPMCQNHVSDFAPVGKCHDCDTDRVEKAYYEDKIASLTIQRDAAEALARERLDPAHARAMADAVADRLFVEGERDAALHDLAMARDHLEAANNAHLEAEEDLEKYKKTSTPIAGRWCLASERDEALAILRDMCGAKTLHEFDSLGIMDRARKLVGGGT